MTDPLTLDLDRLHKLCIERWGERITNRLLETKKQAPEALRRALAAAVGEHVEQNPRAYRPLDEITILSCQPGWLAAKRYVEGIEQPFSAGKYFFADVAPVEGLATLAAVLDKIQGDPRLYVIRGRLRPGVGPNAIRRTHRQQKSGGFVEEPSFEAAARRWLMIDLDSLPLPDGISAVDCQAVGNHARSILPEPFRRAACWAQLTGGAGIKPGARCRLVFWLDRPISDAECKVWLRTAPVDRSLYTPSQPHLVANPIFVRMVDPVPIRSTVLPGEFDAVPVPNLQETERPKPAPVARKAVHPARGARQGFSPYGRRRGGPAGAEQYAAALLRVLAGAQEGERHQACVRIACLLLGLAKSNLLDPIQVGRRVKGVMASHGYAPGGPDDLREIDDILTWAWQHAEPWELGR